MSDTYGLLVTSVAIDAHKNRARELRNLIELELYHPTNLLGELWACDDHMLQVLEAFFKRVNVNRVSGRGPNPPVWLKGE